MKRFRFNRLHSRIFIGTVIALCSGLATLFSISYAADAGKVSADVAATEKIHIISDRLEADNNANWAEFIGNVHATQGKTIIESDRLKVYYKPKDQKKEKSPSGSGGDYDIDKVVASGNVKIVFEDRLAYTDKAVYLADTNIFVLTGANTRVTSGQNSITGDKIIVNRNTNHMTVEGTRKKRVEAIFYSKEKLMQ